MIPEGRQRGVRGQEDSEIRKCQPILNHPVEELRSLAKEDRDGSLRAIGVAPEQAVADLDRLKKLVRERQPEQEKELETMLERYLGASPPREGEKATVAKSAFVSPKDQGGMRAQCPLYPNLREPLLDRGMGVC
jgi:hypothetical protein